MAEDLNRPGLCGEKVLSTVFKFLEVSLIRIDNDEYAQENGSFGLTTTGGIVLTGFGLACSFILLASVFVFADSSQSQG